MTKKEDKIKHELESNNFKLKETENEANLLNAQVERQERELKQRDASSKSDNVRDGSCTSELRLKVNCILKVNCRKYLGWLG